MRNTSVVSALFRCIRCNHVDMTDLARSETQAAGKRVNRYVCTKCNTGQWHGQFPYLPYNPKVDNVVNPPQPPSCS